MENENDVSLRNKTIAFIGAGNMGEALIRGLLAGRTVVPSQIIATDVRAERRDFLTKTFGVRAIDDNLPAVKAADIVVLAVKPQQVGEVLAGFKSAMSNRKLVISIAAGVTTARIERELGEGTRVMRVMPNTPALVGAGAAAVAKGAHATDDDLATAECNPWCGRHLRARGGGVHRCSDRAQRQRPGVCVLRDRSDDPSGCRRRIGR